MKRKHKIMMASHSNQLHIRTVMIYEPKLIWNIVCTESVKHEARFSSVLSALDFYFYPVEVRGNYQPKLGKYISHDKKNRKTEV